MVQDGRASESPVVHLSKTNAKTDRCHERQALEPDEMRRLLETTITVPKRFGMEGHERALLYRVAAETGLRRKELQNLKISSFGGTYKRLTNKTAIMLKADLADAGIPYVDDAERYADFHLRHTTGSLLAASGVHPKVAQSIMRHGDINLTMSLYTHTLRGQETEAGTAPKSLQTLYLSTDREHMSPGDTGIESNAPGRTRTCNLRIRSPRLYPIELRAQNP